MTTQNIPVSQFPVAIGLDGSEAVPIVQGGVTKRTTVAAIGNTATGYVPTSRRIDTGDGLTGGGDLSSNLTLQLDIFDLPLTTEMVPADQFAINASSNDSPQRVSFPDAMKAISGLTHKSVPSSSDQMLVYSVSDADSRYSTVNELLAAAGSLPVGGTIGQPLIKLNSTNFNTEFNTLQVIGGGTGQIVYAVGDILYANSATSLAKLPDVATGSVLVSGGIGASPSYSATPFLTSLALGGASIGSNALAVTGTAAVSSTVTGGTFVPTLNTIPTDGMYLNAAGQVAFAAGSTRIFFINSTGLLMANASGATLTIAAATATAPTLVPRRSDSGTGIGSSGAGSLSLISTSIEQVRVNNGSIYVGGASTGTNIAAVAPVISGALSTGTATNPDLVLQTGVATVSGTGQAVATTALTLKGETQAAIFAGPVTVNSGTIGGLTSFGVRSTGSAFDLKFATSGVFTTNRTISFSPGDANRTIALSGGDILFSGAFTMSGNFGFTGTLTGTTSVTFPTSGTLATTSGASIPSVAQGDLLYGSATNVLSALVKDTNATRYLSNTGTTNNPAWAQIALATGVSGQLPLANGGTNASLAASNGGIFYSTASAGAILAGTATASLPLLSGATGAPTWATVSHPTSAVSGGIPFFSSTSVMGTSALLTANAIVLGGGVGAAPATLGSLGTTTTVLHGNAAGAPTFGAVSLTTDVSGTLSVGNGGTGVASNTVYAVLCGGTTTTNPIQSVASVGSSGNVLTSNGPGALPTFQALAGTGDVVGPASATDTAIVRFNGTTGKLIQNSGVLIDGSNNVTGANSVRFATSKGIADDSGNNQILFVKAATAVNYLTATNAATGGSPSIIATGSDTFVGLKIGAKGVGGYTSILDDFGAVAIQFQPHPVGAGTSSYLMYRPGYSSGATSGNNPEFDVVAPAGSPVTNQGVSFRGLGAWFHAFHSTVTGKSKVKLYPANDDVNGVLLTTPNTMSGSYEFAFPPALGATNDVLYDSGSGFTRLGRPPTVAHAVCTMNGGSAAFARADGFSSATKNATGDYTLTMGVATVDTASTILANCRGSGSVVTTDIDQPSTTTVRIKCFNLSGAATDPTYLMVSVFSY